MSEIVTKDYCRVSHDELKKEVSTSMEELKKAVSDYVHNSDKRLTLLESWQAQSGWWRSSIIGVVATLALTASSVIIWATKTGSVVDYHSEQIKELKEKHK